ncbi:hypothetical protein CFAM422_011185 [Trichoderma lentiforme]|uniref:Uncharacterized protein n=1 Tax=Trichoderma lentiforme TaxID=1567552 RepID=A0A9P4X6X7_9HYPO|nr:hypothetical protein CFAM422_011185 [Trichoderma lentiforme]
MVRATKALKRPFITVWQAWEDYQVGRAIRRRMPTIVLPDVKEKCHEKCTECEEYNNKKYKDETPNECEEDCEEECQGECQEKNSSLHKDQCKDKVRSQPVRDKERAARKVAQLKRSWRYYRYHEFPWVLCQPLPFPFGEESSVLPSEGGQDDMMVWLGKSQVSTYEYNLMRKIVPIFTSLPCTYGSSANLQGFKDLFEMQIRVRTYDTTEDAQNGSERTRW